MSESQTLLISSLLASSPSRCSMTFTLRSFDSVVEGTSSSFAFIKVKTSGNAVLAEASLLFPYSLPYKETYQKNVSATFKSLKGSMIIITVIKIPVQGECLCRCRRTLFERSCLLLLREAEVEAYPQHGSARIGTL